MTTQERTRGRSLALLVSLSVVAVVSAVLATPTGRGGQDARATTHE